MNDEIILNKRILIGVGALTFAMIAWFFFGKMDVVVSAEGRVVPVEQVKIIQNLEGGIVTEIHVQPGDRVRSGAPLFKLSDVGYKSELTSARRQLDYLRIRSRRLEAEISGGQLFFDPELVRSYPDSIYSEREEFLVRKEKRRDLEKGISLVREEKSIVEKMVLKGLEPRTELLRAERGLAEKIQMARELTESTLAEFNKTQAEVGARAEVLASLQDKILRTDVRAPVDGTVGVVNVNTVGGVVKPGEPLATVVPSEGGLLVEAKLKPADVAFVRVGSPAKIQLSAYDSSIFGRLEGSVVNVSPDSTVNEKGEAFYLIRLRSNGALAGKDGRPLDVIPGMMAQVGIITEERTFAQYLFKPLNKLYKDSFKER